MRRIKVRLLDCGWKHHEIARQVIGILNNSNEPGFEVIPIEGAPRKPTGCARSDPSSGAALTLMAFDEHPEDFVFALLLEAEKQRGNGNPCIAVIQGNSASQIAHLFELGATDVWIAPLRGSETIGRALHWAVAALPPTKREIARLKEALGLQGIVGESPILMEELKKLPTIANSETSTLILGETGTGKELCARAIHSLSPRNSKPFIPVNSGALPPDLVENELFGHETGAFTSANAAAKGLIQQANGGTLFLDEIDSLPLAAQVKLLRFLQHGEYRPLGSHKAFTADIRVVAATNANLPAEIRTGRFREDLYYRLAGVDLKLPPLRERGRDIELLARHFLDQHAGKLKKQFRGFTAAAALKLVAYGWPGNAREVDNVMGRTALFARHEVVQPEDIALPLPPIQNLPGTLKALIDQTRRNYLSTVLQEHHGNISRAARAAGLDRGAFWRLLQKHGLTTNARIARGNPPSSLG